MSSLSNGATTEDRLPYPLPTNDSISNPRFINSSSNSILNAPISRLQRKPSFRTSRQIAPPPHNESHDAIGESRRQPRQPHSRSSSTGGVRETAGAFNRWSQSTASSAGGHIRSRSNSFSRLSFGGSGLHGNGVGQSPPRKLQKSRPSIDNSPQRRPTERPANPPLPSSLPPIITLPLSQQSGSHSSSPLASALTPSTAGLLSAAVHSTVPDYFEKSSVPRDISHRRSPSRPGNHSISHSPISALSTETATHRRPSEGESSGVRGHSRNRSRAEKSSSSSRSSKPVSQKAMLSKALQKANTAVLLDNAQNYEGAIQAYSEACSLLQQVMARSSGDEDRRKLEAIRNTYTSRINELARITPELNDEKALPATPESAGFRSDELPMSDDDDELATIETATVTRIIDEDSYPNESQHDQSFSTSRQLPSRKDRLPYPLPTNDSISNPRFINSSSNSILNAPISRLQRKPSFRTSRQIAPPPHNESHDAIGESRRQPRQPHSRSSSTGGVRETAGAFNRWSQSTASSAGGHIRSRSNSFSRLSFGGSGLHGNGVGQSPPRKLQKSRPSIDNSPQRRPTERPANPPLPSSLPPIITLPLSQQSGSHSSSPLASALTPSTAGLLSAAVHSTVPDYFEKSSVPRDISHRRSPSRPGNHSISHSPISALSTETATHRRPSEGESSGVRGHSRNRSRAEKSSSSSRSSKPVSQKAMLSKALQKANTAVLLDNAQNYEGAIQAYSEACSLLQQVMARSSGDEDRRKLEAIRNTYTSRINELARITPELNDEKALPATPESAGFRSDELPMSDDDDELATIETATVTRIIDEDSYPNESQHDQSFSTSRQLPSRSESSLPSALNLPQTQNRNHPDQRSNYFSRFNHSQGRNSETSLTVPMESQYMPPPLSPRRPVSPMTYGPSSSGHRRQRSSESPSSHSNSNLAAPATSKGHTRAPSNESMSWLDTIDESGGSAASSVHSRSSSLNVRRKHIRAASGETEAEFDAALDAAVEAAYDDGFEPVDPEPRSYGYGYDDDDDEIVASVRRKVELAKERVRQSEREAAIEDARERERKRLFLQMQEPHIGPHDDYEGDESEEEERMLEEMTRGYVMDDFEFGLQSKSALPRESDSSGSFSGRTWHSSNGSIPPLTTVAETSTISPVTLSPPRIQPPHPPPSHALPPPPVLDGSPVRKGSPAQSVRSRRLSGQNAKQLKIETSTRLIEANIAPLTLPPSMPPPQVPNGHAGSKTAGLPQQRQGSISMRPPIPTRQGSVSGPSLDFTAPPTAFLTRTLTNDSNENFSSISRSGSPNRSHSRAGLRKNFSSSSLKNVRSHNLSVSNLDEFGGVMPPTPLTAQGNNINGKMPAMPTLPTPIAAAFKERMNGAPTGGLYLFNSDLHSPDSPGSANPMSVGAPIPLEPCPTEYLLRPFWLMRALYQTIAHPRGGYLSTKLFIPRDVWRVKGVKIKGIEDKIANCDFLTAALMKLGQVDTCDADAVLEEMQSLEGILEQVQTTLSKKLGSEVGVNGSNGMFKDATMGESMDYNMSSKSGSVSSKASSFSWRRLRSKNSAMGLANNYSNKVTSPDIPKEGLTMATLPMTSTPRTRFAKRDVSQVQFSGPNANYMSALARLFDAAQAIDQIARQVEDPGLRHADKTQVGLELCTRHASEFFGFYICRFVLNDISLLLDKFIKRGSEWVLV
ncbi:hypothetical protein NHQ30_008715 [Ciborinia camelliae]|nr:hypothetical protein NHQ30_008715 [Ciborinia camelliae]